jgi:hypothetical protein
MRKDNFSYLQGHGSHTSPVSMDAWGGSEERFGQVYGPVTEQELRELHKNSNTVCKKGKAITVKDPEDPLVCETSRVPHFLNNRLTDGGEIVSLTCRPPFTPQVLISVRG